MDVRRRGERAGLGMERGIGPSAIVTRDAGHVRAEGLLTRASVSWSSRTSHVRFERGMGHVAGKSTVTRTTDG